ncbi:hypothetical protein CEP54_014094 [Fusarium duplospermum]|uniref:Uncharacterized protein n=1 Tax=Fusarium duplospermum TaxID=1325734 RepID=A0A428NYU9_9HYPO|nr:hypothetical protein CEP54_014094 [Fusarium duplospermum]
MAFEVQGSAARESSLIHATLNRPRNHPEGMALSDVSAWVSSITPNCPSQHPLPKCISETISPLQVPPEITRHKSAAFDEALGVQIEVDESDVLDELEGLRIGFDYLEQGSIISEALGTGYMGSDISEDQGSQYDERIEVGGAIGADERACTAMEIMWPSVDPETTPIRELRESPSILLNSFDRLRETTSAFIVYLQDLSPSKSGSVECPFCHWDFKRELDVYDIRYHFQICPQKDLDWRIPYQFLSKDTMGINEEETQARKIIASLLGCCSGIRAYRERLRAAAQAKLPSADGFLKQIRSFCDGQLTCIGPKCKVAQFFDASWDGLRSHYEARHADHILQNEDIRDILDIEHHFDRHGESIKQLFAKARARRDQWGSMDHHAREMEEERCRRSLECEHSAFCRLSMMPQMRVLKDVDKVFRARYQQFRRLIAKSPVRELTLFTDELRDKCPKPKTLRRLGMQVFQQVVQGGSPNTLLEVFAFISLSQAMTVVMCRRGIQVDLNPGTIDYHAWRGCIQDETEKHLYDQLLLAWFHPRWQEELHSGGTNQTPSSVQEAMKKLVLQLMQAKQTNAAFKFSAFLKLDPFIKKQAHRGSADMLWDDDCAPSDPPADNHSNKVGEDDPGGNGIEALISTAIFIGTWLFMIYISVLGVGLLYLRNPEQRFRLITEDGEEHVASARNVLLAAEKMKDRVLNRLRQHSSITVLDGIVKDVEEALDHGYVWSVSDLHVCLEQAVQPLTDF